MSSLSPDVLGCGSCCASSSPFSSKCICSTEHCALQEQLLAQTLCCSFTQTSLGMSNPRVLPGISGTGLWNQTELIVFSCPGQGVPSALRDLRDCSRSVLSLRGRDFPGCSVSIDQTSGVYQQSQANTRCCEHRTSRIQFLCVLWEQKQV